MGKYRNGLESQQNIWQVCRRLFYEYGLDGTTYAKIAAEADVRVGTIAYHFGNLLNIASNIATEEQKALEQTLTDLVGTDYNPYEIMTTAYYLHLITFFRDEKYRRFHTELESAAFAEMSRNPQQDNSFPYYDESNLFYREEYRKRSNGNDPLLEEFYFSIFPGISNALNLFIRKNIERLSPEQALHYSLLFYCQIIRLSAEEIADLTKTILSIRKKVSLSNDGLHIQICLS